jgi:hypothetical protein
LHVHSFIKQLFTITLFEAPYVHVLAFKNGMLVGFVMFIFEVSFYWRLVHGSKYTFSLSFYSTTAKPTTPLNMTCMLPPLQFLCFAHNHVARPYGLDGQYHNSFFLHLPDHQLQQENERNCPQTT